MSVTSAKEMWQLEFDWLQKKLKNYEGILMKSLGNIDNGPM